MSLTTLVFLIPGVVIAHFVLILAATRRNVLFILTAIFFVLSPLSTASLLPGVGLAKIGRVYFSVLIPVTGFALYRIIRFGPAVMAFLMFIAVYFVAAAWSGPLIMRNAFLYKGLYVLTSLGGFMLAMSANSLNDVRKFMRVLTVGSFIFAAIALSELVFNPLAISRVGRLSLFGMNPNSVGQAAAPMLIVCAYIALYDSEKRWKALGYISGALQAVLILSSASRGAAGMAAIGCFALAFPLVRRPFYLAFLLLLVFGTISIALSLTGSNIVERFQGASLDTRQDRWHEAMTYFRNSPMIGHGWVTSGIGEDAGTRNMHSIYMQILAETGMLGAFVFLMAIVITARRGLRLFVLARHDPGSYDLMYLAGGLYAGVLAHGVIEAGAVMGSTINGVMLAFAIAMFDRLPSLIHAESDWSFPDDVAHPDTEGDPFSDPAPNLPLDAAWY